jgi:hypothetical protein
VTKVPSGTGQARRAGVCGSTIGVIPKPRVFTSGARACPEQVSGANASNGNLARGETNLWRKLHFYGKAAILSALILAFVSAVDAQNASESSPPPRPPGPAESLYLQLSAVGLDPSRVFKVRDAALDRASIHITLEDGTIAFTKDVSGKITGAFFEGDGEVLLEPPNDVERRSMSLFTGMAILEERFATAYFRFNDDSAAQLQSGLRKPDQPEEFVAHWNDTAHNLAQFDATRLLASFSALLPSTSQATGADAVTQALDPDDHMFHARLQGTTLGVFDIFYDSTAAEEIEVGQFTTGGNASTYFNVWTSFSTDVPNRNRVGRKPIAQALPAETESKEDRFVVRSYVIDAHVTPPKELQAGATLQVEVLRGGSRFLAFDLSRFLEVKAVEVDGYPVEFIHNPAVEGTRRARSGNDIVAVILPEPARKGQKLSLHFTYAGEVLSEAGPGLLYVGARGTWYPNRGLAMADFDLTFHYPEDWTLIATGKPEPFDSPQSGGEQVTRWVSERPIPVAGFNLGKYIRAEARAGEIKVETYATKGVEKDFPTPSLPTMPIDPRPPLPALPPPLLLPPKPSPARNAAAVADLAAGAIRYFSDRFGPFPYSQLALTQLPGEQSQGWPGLIFLSSYAFLNREEQSDLHFSPAGMIIDQLIPVHETAHQWWGDLVTWSTYRDQWFSEGLANYCTFMMEQEKNPTGFHLLLENYRKQLAGKDKDGNFLKDAGPVTLGSRLLSSRFPDGYEAISYGRGTWLFHMLRSMLQDAPENRKQAGREEPFVRSLRKLRERYAGKAVTTRELLQVFAEDLPPSLRYDGKASLDWFLDGWVNGTSLPVFELQGVKFASKPNGSVVTGIIRQKDAPPTLVTSVPIYAVIANNPPVFLGRVFADGPETSFRLTGPAGAHKLLFDPDQTVLTAPK